MSIVKELVKDIEFEIYRTFENKIEDADIPESLKKDFYNDLKELVEDIETMISTVNQNIDYSIYEFSEECRRDTLDDMRTQEYLERDLFEEV